MMVTIVSHATQTHSHTPHHLTISQDKLKTTTTTTKIAGKHPRTIQTSTTLTHTAVTRPRERDPKLYEWKQFAILRQATDSVVLPGVQVRAARRFCPFALPVCVYGCVGVCAVGWTHKFLQQNKNAFGHIVCSLFSFHLNDNRTYHMQFDRQTFFRYIPIQMALFIFVVIVSVTFLFFLVFGNVVLHIQTNHQFFVVVAAAALCHPHASPVGLLAHAFCSSSLFSVFPGPTPNLLLGIFVPFAIWHLNDSQKLLDVRWCDEKHVFWTIFLRYRILPYFFTIVLMHFHEHSYFSTFLPFSLSCYRTECYFSCYQSVECFPSLSIEIC